MALILCIDFDGVIHSYVSGWKGVDVIRDPPVDGAIDWLTRLISDDRYDPQIYSSRSKDPSGVIAMKSWFKKHDLNPELLKFPTQKPAAFLTIDDRAICFEGVFPDLDQICKFKAWNKRKEVLSGS